MIRTQVAVPYSSHCLTCMISIVKSTKASYCQYIGKFSSCISQEVLEHCRCFHSINPCNLILTSMANNSCRSLFTCWKSPFSTDAFMSCFAWECSHYVWPQCLHDANHVTRSKMNVLCLRHSKLEHWYVTSGHL